MIIGYSNYDDGIKNVPDKKKANAKKQEKVNRYSSLKTKIMLKFYVTVHLLYLK